jgi:hypothetical protein
LPVTPLNTAKGREENIPMFSSDYLLTKSDLFEVNGKWKKKALGVK